MKNETTLWEMAENLNQTICVRLVGPIYGVYYPHRKTGDLYIAPDNLPIRCCQCDQDIPADDGFVSWSKHIRSHSRRRLSKPIIFTAKDNDGKVISMQEKVNAG